MSATSTSEPVWLDDEQQAAWRALLKVVQRLPGALDRKLRADAGIPHTYYFVMAMLSEAPGRSLRMSELAALAEGSQSRLSHAVARLEERGWVRRMPCPQDGRGQVAVLTDEGMDMITRTAPGHVAEVRRLVFEGLTREQVQQLHLLAGTISARLG